MCNCKVICIEHDNELTGHQIERCLIHDIAPQMFSFLMEMRERGGPLTPLGLEQLNYLIAKGKGAREDKAK